MFPFTGYLYTFYNKSKVYVTILSKIQFVLTFTESTACRCLYAYKNSKGELSFVFIEAMWEMFNPCHLHVFVRLQFVWNKWLFHVFSRLLEFLKINIHKSCLNFGTFTYLLLLLSSSSSTNSIQNNNHLGQDKNRIFCKNRQWVDVEQYFSDFFKIYTKDGLNFGYVTTSK